MKYVQLKYSLEYKRQICYISSIRIIDIFKIIVSISKTRKMLNPNLENKTASAELARRRTGGAALHASKISNS